MSKLSRTGKRRKRPPAQPEYDSPNDFARKANIGRTTVWRMMKDGRLRYALFGPRLPRIPHTEYERLSINTGPEQVRDGRSG